MRRLYPASAYAPDPDPDNFWQSTVAPDPVPDFEGEARAEVAIIGAGVTGLNAALRLAERGIEATVLDAAWPGWGASGRNGGFVGLGGTKIAGETLVQAFGDEGARRFFAAQLAAVEHVRDNLERHRIAADAHGAGEYVFAHRPRAFDALERKAVAFTARYGARAQVLSAAELAERGLESPALYGAMWVPVGFGLNPLKYVLGLARAARAQGVRVHGRAPVERIEPGPEGFRLALPRGTLAARRIIVATNGYSSEDVPDWLTGRYLPAPSNILVTRPLTKAELAAQNWTRTELAADTRILLHYFRLMPDGRFLFGMRGGTGLDAAEIARTHRLIRADFERMFPAWRAVETPFFWSGLVCLARDLSAYIGPIPDLPGAFAALAYHGNGVAMGSYAGQLVADLAAGALEPDAVPLPLARPLARFPLPSLRRHYLKAAYPWLAWRDG